MSSNQSTKVSLDHLVDENHQYRKLKSIFNFNDANRELLVVESKSGYKGYGILRIFKCLLIQFIEDMSDRELEQYLCDNNAAKWFCDFDLMEKIPDHTVFSRTRKKIGTNLLAKLFLTLADQLNSHGDKSEIANFIDLAQLEAKAKVLAK